MPAAFLLASDDDEFELLEQFTLWIVHYARPVTPARWRTWCSQPMGSRPARAFLPSQPGRSVASLSTIPCPTVAPASASAFPMTHPSPTLTHEEIVARARELWQRSGAPTDRDLEFWLTAESELRAERERTTQQVSGTGTTTSTPSADVDSTAPTRKAVAPRRKLQPAAPARAER